MKEIVVIGAGKIGSTIADMLAGSGDYQVTVVDQSAAQLEALEVIGAVGTRQLDIARRAGWKRCWPENLPCSALLPFT